MPASLLARGWPTRLEPTVAQDPSPPSPHTFTIAVLPDTQYYAACRSSHFAAQTRWIAEVASARNVQAVVHLGDLTEHNSDAEWQFVRAALQPVDGKLPVLLATGNHDHGDEGTANRRFTLFQKYFSDPAPPTRALLAETLHPGDRENAYYRLTLPSVTLGFLLLEWSPRTKSVEWANRVLSKHPTDRVIFVTHAYLYHDGARYDWKRHGGKQEWNPLAYGTAKKDPKGPTTPGNLAPEGAYDGEMLWQELVRKHEGIFLTLNGHVLGDGAGLLESRGNRGNTVHQVLSNYQMLNEGGLGYLRLIELLPDGRTVRMKTYSPSLDRFATAEDQNFHLTVDPPLW